MYTNSVYRKGGASARLIYLAAASAAIALSGCAKNGGGTPASAPPAPTVANQNQTDPKGPTMENQPDQQATESDRATQPPTAAPVPASPPQTMPAQEPSKTAENHPPLTQTNLPPPPQAPMPPPPPPPVVASTQAQPNPPQARPADVVKYPDLAFNEPPVAPPAAPARTSPPQQGVTQSEEVAFPDTKLSRSFALLLDHDRVPIGDAFLMSRATGDVAKHLMSGGDVVPERLYELQSDIRARAMAHRYDEEDRQKVAAVEAKLRNRVESERLALGFEKAAVIGSAMVAVAVYHGFEGPPPWRAAQSVGRAVKGGLGAVKETAKDVAENLRSPSFYRESAYSARQLLARGAAPPIDQVYRELNLLGVSPTAVDFLMHSKTEIPADVLADVTNPLYPFRSTRIDVLKINPIQGEGYGSFLVRLGGPRDKPEIYLTQKMSQDNFDYLIEKLFLVAKDGEVSEIEPGLRGKLSRAAARGSASIAAFDNSAAFSSLARNAALLGAGYAAGRMAHSYDGRGLYLESLLTDPTPTSR